MYKQRWLDNFDTEENVKMLDSQASSGGKWKIFLGTFIRSVNPLNVDLSDIMADLTGEGVWILMHLSISPHPVYLPLLSPPFSPPWEGALQFENDWFTLTDNRSQKIGPGEFWYYNNFDFH